MKRVWGYLRDHVEWFYAAALAAVGVYLIAHNDDLAGGLGLIGTGIVYIVVIHLLGKLIKRVQKYPTNPPSAEELQADAEFLTKRGLEPLPIPGEQHNVDTCGFCQWRKNNP